MMSYSSCIMQFIMYHAFLLSSQYGIKHIEVAAQRGNRAAVEILFPKTSTIQTISEWSVDGIL